MLILAATPIGNLADASPRLIEAMVESKFIAAEDTRSLLKLANSLGVKLNARLFSLHEHNEGDRLNQILEIAQTEPVLVVSDAGMPTVSDPGFLLVRAAVEAKIEVTVIPGPSAVLSALAVSGLPTDRFTFEGFLPRKQGDRRKMFSSLSREPRTMVFFESPHRILESLEDAVLQLGGDRAATVSRELTKKFEHTERGTLKDLVEWAKSEPKGEMVLVIAGAQVAEVQVADLVDQVLALLADGAKLKEAVAEIASAAGASKSDLYQLVLERRKADNNLG
ncbi:16S rRNA (cytidine(1402)-2'-O)-methyltransferase [Rhodoluna lacicola]|uniref:Ribosomal RNA small subunit methyltransferase I n=1 Tax=Rhodoluna lacicola TaxID=529884 RepID=A0A060JH01_9MICO|nr:16S rRNA (cytidine(1402)-2'-O)-methyltransferase [Rhodoluna lacicola]AIC47822.1 putative S-adenosylmethionine-dependent methyltransferase, YraL family [Rhodoluna lacicola]